MPPVILLQLFLGSSVESSSDPYAPNFTNKICRHPVPHRCRGWHLGFFGNAVMCLNDEVPPLTKCQTMCLEKCRTPNKSRTWQHNFQVPPGKISWFFYSFCLLYRDSFPPKDLDEELGSACRMCLRFCAAVSVPRGVPLHPVANMCPLLPNAALQWLALKNHYWIYWKLTSQLIIHA